MKFGVNTFIWADGFNREQIPLLSRIKEAGFDGVEVPLFGPGDLQDGEVRRALAASGLECTVCSIIPAGLSLVSDDADLRNKTIEHLRGCIRTCNEIEARVIGGPLYAPVGFLPGRRRTEEEWKRVVGAFQSLGPDLDRAGVTAAIEPLNRYETYFLNTAEDAAKLCREIAHEKVGILFDTYHANIEEKKIADAIRVAGPYLKHFHSCENDRGIPGTGHVDWPKVFESIKQTGYDGWLTIESFGFAVGAVSAAASIWRDLAPKAEDIAFQGLRFLKGVQGRV